MKKWILFLLLILYISVKYNNGVALTQNKFVDYPNRDEDELLNTQCPQNLELRWKAKVSSSIRAAPLIVDINSDGKLEIVVPSYIHYLEVLEGSDGDKMPGWPAFHNSSIRTSPILYDIDKDGVREIALATYNGEVLFFRVSGYMIPEKLVIPQLKIERIFHKDLLPDPFNSSPPELHNDRLMEEPFLNLIPPPSVHEVMLNGSKVVNQENQNSQIEADIKFLRKINDTSQKERTNNAGNGTNTRRSLQGHDSKGSEQSHSGSKTNKAEDFPAGLEADAGSSIELFHDSDELAADYNDDYDIYVHKNMSRDEELTAVQHEAMESYVNIDSHILCTPVIADIDNDGVSEMIVAASYFSDHDHYDNPEHLKELGVTDTGKYVAGGIVVFNLDTKKVKWTTDLDVSMDTDEFHAYIYASPTVADLDGDGNLDILVGTSHGLFYVLDHKGKVRKNFPLQIAEIQGAVVAADINDDGILELVITDTGGNVVALSTQGKQIWETHLKSLIPQGPTIGDVDGDGHTDVVVPTLSGNIYVLRGKDGSLLHPYPYRTYGRIRNRILLADLTKRGEKKKGLTIITTSSDGRLYLIDGKTLCADFVDIGETSCSMIVADNVDGGDDLDLIVPTINGSVFCFSTGSPFHPLKAWRSPDQGKNNVANRFNREGIFVTPSSRAFRNEGGKSFWVEVDIVDRYRSPSGSQSPYNVTTSLFFPGNNKENRTIKQNQVYDRAGKYRIKLPTVGVRTTGTVLVEMVDKNGLYFSDDFSLTFHMHSYKLLKWMLFLLILGMLGLLFILRPQAARPLVLFPRNSGL